MPVWAEAGAPGGCDRGGWTATEHSQRTQPPAPSTIFYINDYIPIYIFTHAHIYLTFFPFHVVVYFPYARLARVRVCVPGQTNAALLFTCFRKGKAFYLSFLLFRCVVEQYLGWHAVEYLPSIYVFHFTRYIFWTGVFCQYSRCYCSYIQRESQAPLFKFFRPFLVLVPT